jgi:hypothetical protein
VQSGAVVAPTGSPLAEIPLKYAAWGLTAALQISP